LKDSKLLFTCKASSLSGHYHKDLIKKYSFFNIAMLLSPFVLFNAQQTLRWVYRIDQNQINTVSKIISIVPAIDFNVFLG
jgi:hypothetical protein